MEGLPAARRLAPTTSERTLTPQEVQAVGKEDFFMCLMSTIAWLLEGLDQQHLKGKAVRQQALELLCAMSDVMYGLMAAPPGQPSTFAIATTMTGISSGISSSSSSSRIQQRGSALAWVLQRKPPGGVVQALRNTAEALNRYVFKRASAVPAELLKTACICCRRITMLIESWFCEQDPRGVGPHLEQSQKLSDWCIDCGLVNQLTEGVLLVLGLNFFNFVNRGSDAWDVLPDAALNAMLNGVRLQRTMVILSRWYENVGVPRYDQPLGCLALQGTGSDGTHPGPDPSPFMRLALVLLAVAQHSRRVAASPTSPAPSGSPEDVAALRAALQRQLTPSCCAQLLQRLAPVVWVVLSVHPTPATLLGLPEGDLCMAAVVEGMMALTPMCCMFGPDEQPAHALGAQELQLMVECVEPLTACTVVSDGGAVGWGTISMLLQACPYSALVEFSTHHSRTLLTLAERSLEAALAAGGGSGGSSSGGGVGRGGPSTGRPVLAEQQLAAAVRIGSCLALCWNGGMSGGAFGAASDTYEAKGYPADATWALLDPSTAPRLLRLMEALVRTPGGGDFSWSLACVLPIHLPEMALFYSSPSAAQATLSAVTSVTKWLQGRAMALGLLLEHPTNRAAAVAAIKAAVPGAVGAALAQCAASPAQPWWHTYQAAVRLTGLALQSLVRAAALLDPASCKGAAAAATAPAGRSTRAWLVEKALLADLPDSIARSKAEEDETVLFSPTGYKAQVFSQPQRVASILEQLQQGVGAQQAAAAARQAAKLAKKQGGDVAALTEQLQAVQVGSSSSNSIKELSAEEVAAVLGALQHVVIPGQPGCSNPRCCCLEGVSEANVKTQVCGGCRGVRYCSAGCQKAHWRAGHKEVCKAAQAAAKAAAGGST